MSMKSIFAVGVIIVGVIITYVFLSLTDSGLNAIASQAASDIAASGNMSQQPGIQSAVAGFPLWKWFIPGFVGAVMVGFVLVKERLSGRLLSLLLRRVDRRRELLLEIQHRLSRRESGTDGREIEIFSASKELPTLWDRIQSLSHALNDKMAADPHMQDLKQEMLNAEKRHKVLVRDKLSQKEQK